MTQARRSAGVVIVRRESGIWRVLMLRAYRNWDFPKGEIESGEDPFAAAIREVKEEADIDRRDLAFNWGQVFTETPPYRQGKIARYYLAETTRRDVTLPVNPALGKPEHDEWRWFTFDEARLIAVPRLQAVLSWAQAVVQ